MGGCLNAAPGQGKASRSLQPLKPCHRLAICAAFSFRVELDDLEGCCFDVPELLRQRWALGALCALGPLGQAGELELMAELAEVGDVQ